MPLAIFSFREHVLNVRWFQQQKKKNVSAPMADMERVFIDIDTVLCVTGVIKNSIAQQKHWQIFRKKKKKKRRNNSSVNFTQ